MTDEECPRCGNACDAVDNNVWECTSVTCKIIQFRGIRHE